MGAIGVIAANATTTIIKRRMKSQDMNNARIV